MSGTLGDLGQLGDGTQIAGFGGGASDPYMMELMRRRAMADALAKQGMAEAQRPMTHWLQPLGAIAQQGVAAWRQGKADDELLTYAKGQAEGDAETRKAMIALALRQLGQNPTPAPQPQPMAPSQGSGAGPAKPSAAPLPIAATTLAPEAKAFLTGVSGAESPGYNVRYGGSTFDGYGDHPRTDVPIMTGPMKGQTSSAAGRYQFLGSTWDNVKAKYGLPDFSPASQDLGAWQLARDTYQAKTGRDLAADMKSQDPQVRGGITNALAGVWPSLPGGNQPNGATNGFWQRVDAAMGGAQPNMNVSTATTAPMPSTPPVAPPMAAGGPPMLDKNPMLVAALMGQASRFPGSQRLGASLATIARAIPDPSWTTVNFGGKTYMVNSRDPSQRMEMGANVQAGHALDAPDVEGQQLRYRQAGATNVALNNDKSYGGHLAEGLAKQDLAAIDTARGAADQIATARRIRTVLEENPIVGPGQPLWMAMAKGLNIAGLTDDQRISSTQALVSELARVTQEHIKSSGLGGGSGFSNADRDFLEKARAGTIEYTPPALRYLADLNEKAARLGLARGNAALARIRKNPNTASLVEGLPDFTDQLPNTSGQGAAPAAASSAPVKVATPEEAAKLPPGTRIELPDGSLGVVPGR